MNQPIFFNEAYVGTAIFHDGKLVLHVFEVAKKAESMQSRTLESVSHG